MMKKRNRGKRNVQLLAAAALTAALMAGQIQPMMVQGNSAEIQVSSLIPDNVTIEDPVPLSEISLPGSEYGTLSWVNSSSVPSERVQSYEVVFRPYNSADLAKISGWDGTSDAIYSSVTVVVNNLDSSSQESEGEWSEGEGDQSYNEGEDEWYEESGGDYTDDGYYEDSESGYDQSENTENSGDEGGQDTEEILDEPEITAAPEPTMTPGITEEPEPSTTPAPTETPGEDGTEETPEITGTPEATVTPEPTETPDGEETEEAPEVTGTPEPTVTPGVTEEPEPSATPAPTETPEDEKDNIFDRENEKDTRPDEYGDDLTDEEKASIAEENHTCNGISVSGISLPWYVQFRATSSDGYEFSNETGANIFKSYEFELWDLKNDAEYHVPDGEYISVTVPVKAGYEYTIEHLLDNGAMETIVPSVDGSTMVFSTHSFSPFGIAGSKTLVGEEIETDGYEDSTAAQTTVTPTASASASAGANTSSESTVTPAASDNESSGQNSGTQNEDSQSSDQDSADAAESVNTGDNTPIVPFVILAVAAVVIIGVIIYLRKRK